MNDTLTAWPQPKKAPTGFLTRDGNLIVLDRPDAKPTRAKASAYEYTESFPDNSLSDYLRSYAVEAADWLGLDGSKMKLRFFRDAQAGDDVVRSSANPLVGFGNHFRRNEVWLHEGIRGLRAELFITHELIHVAYHWGEEGEDKVLAIEKETHARIVRDVYGDEVVWEQS